MLACRWWSQDQNSKNRGWKIGYGVLMASQKGHSELYCLVCYVPGTVLRTEHQQSQKQLWNFKCYGLIHETAYRTYHMVLHVLRVGDGRNCLRKNKEK